MIIYNAPITVGPILDPITDIVFPDGFIKGFANYTEYQDNNSQVHNVPQFQVNSDNVLLYGDDSINLNSNNDNSTINIIANGELSKVNINTNGIDGSIHLAAIGNDGFITLDCSDGVYIFATRGLVNKPYTTIQINGISAPTLGSLVYNTTLNTLCFYDGTTWEKISHSAM